MHGAKDQNRPGHHPGTGYPVRCLRQRGRYGGEPAARGRDAYGEFIAYGTERKAIISGDWKYIVGLADGLEELYHLGQDPMEQVNLAAREKGRVADMRRRLQQHLEACAGRRQWSGERLALQGRMVEELQALGCVE